jgi:hypothetical protein
MRVSMPAGCWAKPTPTDRLRFEVGRNSTPVHLSANPRQILRRGSIMVAGAKGVIERIDTDRPHPHEYPTVVRSRSRKINELVLRITAVGAILDGFHG